MKQNDDRMNTRERKSLGTIALESTGPKRYRVVLEGLGSDYETLESFIIKFSLLAKIETTKVKAMVSKLPVTIWTGQGDVLAKRILGIIREAGGRGVIVEEKEHHVEHEKKSVKEDQRDKACAKCGFPLKEDDVFCSFCMSPVGKMERKGNVFRKRGKTGKYKVPPSRLFLYCIIVFLAIIMSIVAK